MNKVDALDVPNAIINGARRISAKNQLDLSGSSNIPMVVYENLPPLLSECVGMFDDPIEKDVILIGALGVLSGCLPNVEGEYFGKYFTPHLYCFITANAGSGKGNLEWAKILGSKIHESKIHEYKTELEKYEFALNQYESLNKKDKADEVRPTIPKQLMHFIPGNSSSAAIMQALSNNEDKGIIFETEADTVSNIMSQEWGDFSDVLRKAFHHETVSSYRKAEDTLIEMKSPKLSMVLSGTPRQVTNMIKDSENGLFSRFFFYGFEYEGGFKNPFKLSSNQNYNSFFEWKAEEVYRLYKRLMDSKVQFQFTNDQQDRFTSYFNDILFNSRTELSAEFEASVKRLAVIAFRMAMIFSVVRLIDSPNTPSLIICREEDFNNALSIVSIGEMHAANVFVNLLKGKEKRSDKKSKFYDLLPIEFTTKQAGEVRDQLGIPPRTATRYLGDDKLFERVSQGNYRKL